MNSKVINAIKKAASSVQVNINVNEKTLNSTLKDLGVDSLAAMGMIIEVEETLKVRLDDEKLMKIKTLQQLIDAFSTLVK